MILAGYKWRKGVVNTLTLGWSQRCTTNHTGQRCSRVVQHKLSGQARGWEAVNLCVKQGNSSLQSLGSHSTFMVSLDSTSAFCFHAIVLNYHRNWFIPSQHQYVCSTPLCQWYYTHIPILLLIMIMQGMRPHTSHTIFSEAWITGAEEINDDQMRMVRPNCGKPGGLHCLGGWHGWTLEMWTPHFHWFWAYLPSPLP